MQIQVNTAVSIDASDNSMRSNSPETAPSSSMTTGIDHERAIMNAKNFKIGTISMMIGQGFRLNIIENTTLEKWASVTALLKELVKRSLL